MSKCIFPFVVLILTVLCFFALYPDPDSANVEWVGFLFIITVFPGTAILCWAMYQPPQIRK